MCATQQGTQSCADAGFAWQVLEEIDYGVLLVSPGGILQHANQLARHALSHSRFLQLDGARLRGATPAQTEEVLLGVQSAARGCRQMLTLRCGEDTLPVACVPMAHRHEASSISVLLMLARQASTQNQAVAFFSRMHGFTPAEEAVLKALCAGQEVHEIAAAQGVSEYTIRTQVRSLRDKTGASSIRLLTQRVATLPPLVSGAPAVSRGA
jgi:DNA-binding CsgD family transcriptional regulator